MSICPGDMLVGHQTGDLQKSSRKAFNVLRGCRDRQSYGWMDAPSLEIFKVGFEQPDVKKDVSAHGRGIGLDDL